MLGTDCSGLPRPLLPPSQPAPRTAPPSPLLHLGSRARSASPRRLAPLTPPDNYSIRGDLIITIIIIILIVIIIIIIGWPG